MPVGLRHQVDHLPLAVSGLWTVLEGFHHFLFLASLPVLFNQTPFSHPLRVIQHHCEEMRGEGGEGPEGKEKEKEGEVRRKCKGREEESIEEVCN